MATCTKPGCNTAVLTLQETLKTFATGTGFAAADPGVVDGIVGANTIRAVAAIAPQIPGLPGSVKTILGVAGFTAIFAPDEAKRVITSYAGQINAAIVATYAIRVATGDSPAPSTGVPALPTGAGPMATFLPSKTPTTPASPVPAPYVPPKPDWWTTPTGIGLLVGGTVAAVGLMFMLGNLTRR